MSPVTLPIPQLFTEETPVETHINRVASIIALPETHTLAYVDYALNKVRFSFYIEDPKITCPALERNSDDDDDNDSRYQREINEFVENNCDRCKYYFDEKDVEGEDEDGNELTTTIRSACNCYRNGIDDFLENCNSTECHAGHTLPDYHDENDERQLETDTQVYIEGKCWDKTTVPSAPLYYSIKYISDYRYDLYEIWCGVGFAKKIPAFESNEYMYLLSPMWRALNTYSDVPSRVCWGEFSTVPMSANVDSLHGLYSSSTFNNDLEQFYDYRDSIDDCNNAQQTVDEFVGGMERADDIEEYKQLVEGMKEEANDANYLLTTEPDRFIVSCDAWEKKANALLVVDKNISTKLFYKLYISGIPCPIRDVLSKSVAVYSLYKYRYINPQNPEQYVDGYVTQPNSSGVAWFFVQNYDLVAPYELKSEIYGLNPENSYYHAIYRNNCTENLALSFGQIQL